MLGTPGLNVLQDVVGNFCCYSGYLKLGGGLTL